MVLGNVDKAQLKLRMKKDNVAGVYPLWWKPMLCALLYMSVGLESYTHFRCNR